MAGGAVAGGDVAGGDVARGDAAGDGVAGTGLAGDGVDGAEPVFGDAAGRVVVVVGAEQVIGPALNPMVKLVKPGRFMTGWPWFTKQM